MATKKLRPITMKEVAEKAGVSYQTVSRAINGHGDISAETREKVMRVVKQMGYTPNRLAGSLRTNNTKVIGLVVSDLENSFHAEVAAGIEAEAGSTGYSVILANSGEDVLRERQAVLNLFERRVDGLILSPAQGDHAYVDADLPRSFPIVTYNRRLDHDRYGAVLLENTQAAQTAVKYLISRGHTRIGAVIASPELMTSRERLEGFKQSMDAAGLEVRSEWLGTGRSAIHPEGARSAAMRIFSRGDHPTAMMTSSSRITEGVLVALRELGLKHGRDVEIVSFDNAPWASLLDPPLPVIAQPTQHMGREATRMLVTMINGGSASISRLPGKLLTHREEEIKISA